MHKKLLKQFQMSLSQWNIISLGIYAGKAISSWMGFEGAEAITGTARGEASACDNITNAISPS
jgi:hypothetical protein